MLSCCNRSTQEFTWNQTKNISLKRSRTECFVRHPIAIAVFSPALRTTPEGEMLGFPRGNAYVKACLKSWGITRMILVGSSQWWTEGGMHSFAQVYAPFYERLHLAQRRVHHGGCLPWRRKNPSPSFPNLNHNGLSETVMNVYIGFRKNVTDTERNFGVLLNF